MTSERVKVVRRVDENDPHNYLGRTAEVNEILYTFPDFYGCVDELGGGISLSEQPGEYPYFEFPADAIEFMEEK